jgi:hypothetical protein
LARKILYRVAGDVVGEFTADAERVWAEMVEKYLFEKASVEPIVSIGADESWATAALRYVVDFKRRRSTKKEVFTAILDALTETAGTVQIASTSQEITLMQG